MAALQLFHTNYGSCSLKRRCVLIRASTLNRSNMVCWIGQVFSVGPTCHCCRQCGFEKGWLSGRASDFWSKGPGLKTICGRTSDFLVEGTWVQNHLRHFEAWATSFTPVCLCLLEETVKAVGPFYLVSMPGK